MQSVKGVKTTRPPWLGPPEEPGRAAHWSVLDSALAACSTGMPTSSLKADHCPRHSGLGLTSSRGLGSNDALLPLLTIRQLPAGRCSHSTEYVTRTCLDIPAAALLPGGCLLGVRGGAGHPPR